MPESNKKLVATLPQTEATETKQEDFELTLFDRLNVIRDTITKYGVDRFYLSFSGGKDSTVLHYMLDEALPGNKIPRVFINTGIEYNDIVKFVKDMAEEDDRIVIISPEANIKQVLEKYGYPFKSKDHSNRVYSYQCNGLKGISVRKYLEMEEGTNMYKCPAKLRHQFEPDYPLKISDKCCKFLKKKPARKWEKENHKETAITGIRMTEGGNRQNHPNCVSFTKDGRMTFFKPLNPCSDAFVDWYMETRKIKLCKLYYPPFNFKRTGCKGCPFNLKLREQLKVMEEQLPTEKLQCEVIWKPVYEEYRKLKYRLRDEK